MARKRRLNRGLAYAGGVHVPFWSQAVKRRYHTPSGADDTVFVATDDGVKLAVKHFRPFAGTRLNLPPVGLVRQLADWIANDAIRSVDHAVDYRDALRSNDTPTLVVEAPRDGLAPPASVRRALSLLTRAEHSVADVASGCAVDHGHIDVVFGRSAPRDVFPRLVGFLTSPGFAPPDSTAPHDFTRSA